MKFLNQTHWMWTDAQDISPDIYRLFRNKFTYVPNGEKVFLEISVCSTWELRINGTLLQGQQVSDFPDAPTGSCFDVTEMLRPGENEVLLQIHYMGEDFLTCLEGKPFVKFALFQGETLLLQSDDTWECCDDVFYRSGLRNKITFQLGFSFEYNAQAALPPDGSWKKAVITDKMFEGICVSQRKVPQLNELEMPAVKIVQSGVFKRTSWNSTFAASCMTDALIPIPLFDFTKQTDEAFTEKYAHAPFVLNTDGSTPFTNREQTAFGSTDGIYLILDTGREQVGYLTLDITAPAGTVIDICHGEHLDSGRVAAKIDHRDFADRYVCREGRNRFSCRHRRLGGRYIELHILNTSEITLNYCGLLPLELPLPPEAAFDCEDRLLLKNRELAVRTLHLCMHEHYEDCPWREQALYGYDSRNQILYGYYTWGNYEFAAASLDLLGRSFDGKRYFTLTAPGRLVTRTIPVFTFIWITELLEYQLFSGDGKLFQKWQSLVNNILEIALADKVPGHEEFYHPGTEPHIWNFCEWNGRLADVLDHPSSTYNVYLFEALTAAAKLHTLAGNEEKAAELKAVADRLGEALRKAFWNDRDKIFRLTLEDAPDEYEHVQAIFLANGLADDRKEALVENIISKKLKGISFSGLPYMLKALHESSAEGRAYLYSYLDELFTPMLLAGATSLWETSDGSAAFNRAGSLCHAWSSVIPCYCGSKLLGVKPLEPGFRRFEVKPYCGKLTHASGEVPTPGGFISVKWTLTDGMIDLELKHPEGMTPVIASFEEFPIRSVNGKIL